MLKYFLAFFLIASVTSHSISHKFSSHDEFVVITKSPRYYYNEAEQKGECSLNAMCDGQRKCSHEGKCVGQDRPPKSADYFYDQTITKAKCPVQGDFNFAIADYFCNAKRTCKDGSCVGSER